MRSTKLWWTSSVLAINERPGINPEDVLVVVTHGLTMRFMLMQLFGWSPNTFGSVWKAGNCSCYGLNKDHSTMDSNYNATQINPLSTQ